MQPNSLSARLKDGNPCYGVLSPITDPTVCEYLCLSGLQFYMIDAEHGPINPGIATNLVRACEWANCTPLARIRSLDAKLILQYLDIGIMGIMMPGIKTAEEVNTLVQAIKYPPTGVRGFGPARPAKYFLDGTSMASYIDWANRNILVLPQIETPEAVEQIDSILKIEGVDGIIVGPADLSLAMGMKEGPGDPAIRKIIKEVFLKAKEHNKFYGTVAFNGAQAQQLVDDGAQLILGFVHQFIQAGAKAFLNAGQL